MYFFLSGCEQGLEWYRFGIDLCTVVMFFFSYLRDVNYFHITHPFSCRVQSSSMNDLRNADPFIPGGHTIKDNLF